MQVPMHKRLRRTREEAFTLIEMMIATVVLLVGLVAIAQLVPMSILMNTANRTDSTSLVIAQRELDALMGQPLSATTFADPLGITCLTIDTCKLGDPAQSGTLVGSPVVQGGNGSLIDFGQALVADYSFSVPYLDPNDPSGTSYDIRWAVITTVNATNNTVTGKRFIVGVRRQGGNTFFPPVTLDSQVEK